MTTAFPDIRALLFDVFGTVVDWRTGIAREAAAFLAGQDRADVDPFAFADAWRALYQPAMAAVRSGARPFVRLDVLHREMLETVLRARGIDPATVGDPVLTDLAAAWHRLDPWPDAVAGLVRLKARYVVAPLSNGNVALLLNMARRAGLPWDAILGAEVVRAYKPDPRAYRDTVDLLGLVPGEVCMVAAHEADLAAAAACGLRTAFVPRPDEHGPEAHRSRVTPAPGGAWDMVAADFGDLADRLGA